MVLDKFFLKYEGRGGRRQIQTDPPPQGKTTFKKSSHIRVKHNLVTMPRSKVALMFNKSACTGMCILDLSKVLMYKFHCDYIKNKYGNNSRPFFTDTDSLMYEIKLKMSLKKLAAMKKCLILLIIRLSQNTMMIQTN